MFKAVLDKPGMIEAKIMLPSSISTSTPMKPFSTAGTVDAIRDKHQTPAPFDSGFSSMLSSTAEKLEESNISPTNTSCSSSEDCLKPSLFESIRKSRNHSVSLEQLVEKVNLKKEQRNEDRENYEYRSRSWSTSELTVKRKPMPKVDLYRFSGSEVSLYSDISGNNGGATDWSVSGSDTGHSPTLDQVLTMGCNHRSERSYSDTSCDYDLSELVTNMRIKTRGLSAPPHSPSPDSSTCRRTPESLFGLETLQQLQVYSRPESCRPKLECITESDLDQGLSTTPKEYYTTGMSPLPPQPKFPYPQYFSNENNNLDQFGPGSPAPVLSSPGYHHHQYQDLEPLSSTWSGLLPHKHHVSPVFSCKIFLGGVPWDVTELSLIQAFSQFGPIRIEWPGKDSSPSPPKGYAYIVFEHERYVPSLLSRCSQSNGAYYFRISSKRMRSKEVQIIPWVLDDSNFIKNPKQKLDPQKTVFVGALHGMLTAEILARIFNDLFGGVVYAGIDTDKHKYPIGSGRVTFSSIKSYMKAVSAAFVEIKCQQFNKKVQVDPYLEDALCSSCLLKQGPYFCRDLICFKYYCRFCWESDHAAETMSSHRPLMRNTRHGGGPATRPTISLTPAVINIPDPS